MMSPRRRAQLTAMMKQVVKEGTGTAAALEGIEVAGKTGTAELDIARRHQRPVVHRLRRPKVAVAVTLERLQGGIGGDRRRADRQAGARGAAAASEMRERRARHARRRALPGAHAARLGRHGRRLLRRGPAARPPRRAQAAAPRASPRTRSSSSASAARLERRRRCSTRTSSASTTAASGTAPTTSRWSTSTGRTLKQLDPRATAPLEPDARDRHRDRRSCAPPRFAHQRGVVHRDIKPHNVIVDDEGRAKVTDFGIARAGASDMTETGSIMGTAQYLSPEQAQGHAGRRRAPTSTRSASCSTRC